MTVHESIPISAGDSSQVGQARRRAAAVAHAIGLDEVQAGELSIIVSEAARNIALHAGEGELILAPWKVNGTPVNNSRFKSDLTTQIAPGPHVISTQIFGVDVFALDRGPGIFDLDQASEDGYSTAGTAGQGLGAIQRLSRDLHIYSTPGAGTALFARVMLDQHKQGPLKPAPQPKSLAFGALAIPLRGEQQCGDAWSSTYLPDRSLHMIADGLGHGPLASEASAEAVRIFNENGQYNPERILRAVHAALGKTRGAAVAIAEILPEQRILNYAGAGNVAGMIHTGGKTKNMISMNGTVGHAVAKFQQFSYPWERDSLLIMHSDGLGTRTNLEQYSGLASRHPALIAAVLYRDFVRGRDDATVLVTRTYQEMKDQSG